MFDVVSCPAMSSSPAMPISSSVVRSSPCSRTSMPSMSSPGAGLRPGDEVRHVLAALPAQLEALLHRQRDVEQLARALPGTPSRSAYGTPSSSQITSDGIGSAKSATRSAGGPAFSIASRWSSTISTIRGSSRRIRRTVNSGVSIRRSRVCSGGSTPSRLPARIRVALLGAQLRGPGCVEGPAAVVAEPGAVGEHRLDVGVPGDQERGHPEGRLHLPDALVVAQRRHLGHRDRNRRAACAAASRGHLGGLAGLLLQRLRHRRISFARRATLPRKR